MEAKDVELEITKEALRNVERKMEEMRQEMEKLKEERSPVGVYALGFEPSTFMASNPVVALTWAMFELQSRGRVRQQMACFYKAKKKWREGLQKGATSSLLCAMLRGP